MEQTSVTFTAKIATGLPWFVYLILFVLLGAAILVAIIFFRKKRLAKITTLILLNKMMTLANVCSYLILT